MPTTLPTYFISHGGGPWPYMDGMRETMRGLAASLADMPHQYAPPKAIVVVSAHWEESAFSVMSSPQPGMLYDYGGFPPHTYTVVYPAPGAPEVAVRIQSLLAGAGLPVRLDAQRGFDHGTFAPLAVMYPEANVPVLQVSLKTGLDPADHLALGRALAPLRDEGVLIVGSGLSYHNLRQWGASAKTPSAAFDQWLQDTVVGATSAERKARLLDWTAAPAARVAHPREEHLMPLMVAVGAAGDDAATCIYREDNVFGGVTVSSFRFDSFK